MPGAHAALLALSQSSLRGSGAFSMGATLVFTTWSLPVAQSLGKEQTLVPSRDPPPCLPMRRKGPLDEVEAREKLGA